MTYANGSDDPIVIKKYANRRLYDTSTSAYVTLEHLSTLVRDGKEFLVQDARTGEDLTRTVLAQITLDQENSKEGVLPVSFLRQLIQFYGDSFQSMLPAYLELSMKGFSQQKELWRDYMHSALGDTEKAKAYDEQVRKNMEMFEEAVRLFSPFVPKPRNGEETVTDPAASGAAAAKPATPEAGDPTRDLQKQMAEMQKQLAMLATRKPSGE